jgi:hypothetical protein
MFYIIWVDWRIEARIFGGSFVVIQGLKFREIKILDYYYIP